jgi:hypothetical protein
MFDHETFEEVVSETAEIALFKEMGGSRTPLEACETRCDDLLGFEQPLDDRSRPPIPPKCQARRIIPVKWESPKQLNSQDG